MRLRIIAVGQHISPWADSAVRDYLSRFPKDFTVELVEVRTEARNGRTPAQLMAAEAQNILKNVEAGDHVVVLDERGADLTTMALAKSCARWRAEALDVVFIIGGPDGLAPEVKARADDTIKLSSLTLAHAFARVLLAEQLYRAWSILAGHPYHRA